MPDGEPIRILLVEDHTLLREVLARSLGMELDFEVVGHCASVEGALELVGHNPVDLVLLDINLGSEQGGSFLPRAHALGFRGKVLVLTAGVGNREAAWLLRRGCMGIFLKHEPASALVERIREVIRGTPQKEVVPPPAMVSQMGPRDRPHRPLTARECQVLRAVCEGLATKEIAQHLSVSENTVKGFLQQLFEKIGVRTRAQLVAAAIEQYWDQLDQR